MRAGKKARLAHSDEPDFPDHRTAATYDRASNGLFPGDNEVTDDITSVKAMTVRDVCCKRLSLNVCT